MSDRIAVMNRGLIEQVAEPEDVYERPDDHVRRRLHRRLEPDARRGRRGQRRRRARCGLDTGVEIEAAGNGLAAGERCHAVVRPGEAANRPPRRRPRPTAGRSVEGMVESSVYLGTATQIVVRLAGDVADDGAGPERATRPSARSCRAAAPTCGSPGRPSTCTSSGSPDEPAPTKPRTAMSGMLPSCRSARRVAASALWAWRLRRRRRRPRQRGRRRRSPTERRARASS